MKLPNIIFEPRHQMKWWLAGKEHTIFMYTKFQAGSEVCLWCDGREVMVVIHREEVPSTSCQVKLL